MLGLRIALCRKARGMTQATLADRLGVSPSAVGMYEQGRREPSCDILILLSREFDVTIDYLLTGDLDRRTLNPLTKSLTKDDILVFLVDQIMSRA